MLILATPLFSKNSVSLAEWRFGGGSERTLAPELVEANVCVAMGSGTDAAQESADVVLLGSDLERFVEMLTIARRPRGIRTRRYDWCRYIRHRAGRRAAS
jgi:hypothetical protein